MTLKVIKTVNYYSLQLYFNLYSVLTPTGGFLYFLKIHNQINISLITACYTNKIFDFIPKLHNYAVRVKMKIFSNIIFSNIVCFIQSK